MKIVAGVIGTGIGQKHIEAINLVQNSYVKIICEKNKKKFPFLKKKFPKAILTSNENDLFKDKEINLVSIASYDQDHYSQIIKCIKNKKKNIIVEKPLCMNINQLNKISKQIKNDKNIYLLSNLVLRTNRLFNFFKNKINTKEIIYCEFDYIWGRLNKLYGWRSKTKNYSLILGAAIHMIDVMMWLLKQKPIKVTSFSNKIGLNKKIFKKDGLIILNYEFKNKILVKISANATGVYPHFHEVKIFEKNKTLIHNLQNTEILFKRSMILKKNINKAYPDRESRKNLIIKFINSIKKKKKEPISIKYQLDLMRVCFSSIDSLKTNKTKKIIYS